MPSVPYHSIYWFLLLFFTLVSCEKDKLTEVKETEIIAEQKAFNLDIPTHFPELRIPADNQLSESRVALGKKLFFEPRLSKTGKVSCGSCHAQGLAFTDGRAIAVGIEGREGFRNSMSLTNVAYNDFFFRDGGVRTLELQVLAPFDNPDEFDLNIIDALERIKTDTAYLRMFKEAYNREPDVFSLIRAIASFERTFISGNSKFDQWFYQNSTELSASEKRGYELFRSDKLKCASCHSGFNFTNNGFEHNGLSYNGEDPGRYRSTLRQEDFMKFKVTTLRNIAETAPYMHDGRFETLSEVIDHYSSGGVDHDNQSQLVRGFELSTQEKADLIAFLGTLSDEDFLTNPDFFE